MEASNKTVKVNSSQGKLIQYHEQDGLAFTLLIKLQLLDEPLDLEEFMWYSLIRIPPSLSTPMVPSPKLTKPPLLHLLLVNTPKNVPYPKDAITPRMVGLSCTCSPTYLRHW